MKLTNILYTFAIIFCLTACSAVFEGGASGKVVDAESTESPKTGIQDVEVYVYTSEYMRNEDFKIYNGNGKFNPSSSSYIGHTTTAADGTFSLGKLMWESDQPVFGKTGDSIPVFLLFYHENYGLKKNDNHAVILSDSVSYVVYQELTAIRSTTALTLSILDASQDPDLTTKLPPAIAQAANVTLSIPQTTTENQGASPIVKNETITGTGTISVSYPRYSTGTTENEPTITLTYSTQNYKPCNYVTTQGSENYSFITNFSQTPVTRTIKGRSYPIQVYVKPTLHTLPTISGQLCLTAPAANSTQETRGDEGTTADDNVQVLLATINSSGTPETVLNYTSASVMTAATGNGINSSRIIHGQFTGLGQGITWTDDTYAGKYAIKELAVVFDMNNSGTIDANDRYYLLKNSSTPEPIDRALRSNETTRDIGKMTASNTVQIN